jgi:hypothetical protein
MRVRVRSDEQRAGNGFETWKDKVVRLRRVRSHGNRISRRFVFKNHFTRTRVMLGERFFQSRVADFPYAQVVFGLGQRIYS